MLRPRMPPIELHHFANALAASTISLLRPDRPVKPLSVTVPMWISVSVTPLASPFAHTLAVSPNPPCASAVGSGPAETEDPLPPLPLLDDADLFPPLRPHADATSRRTRTSANPRERPTGVPPVTCGP